MSKFYCNKCKEDVELKNGECPKCGTNWKKIMDNSILVESKMVDYYEKVEEPFGNEKLDKSYKEQKIIRDIKDVCAFFLDYAKICKYVCFFLAGVIFIMSFKIIETSFYLFFISFVLTLVLIFMGIILEKSFKWKSYMLRTNYEISKNKK